MESYIISYVNKDNVEMISVWDSQYLSSIKKDCKQLISTLFLEHDEEWWYRVTELSQEDLYELLMWITQENRGYVYFYN